jgi:hypothetical protein
VLSCTHVFLVFHTSVSSRSLPSCVPFPFMPCVFTPSQNFCLLICFLFLHLSSLKWPLWPRLPICAFTMHLSELCLCWFIPYSLFQMPNSENMLSSSFCAKLRCGSLQVYRWAALEWGAHLVGVSEGLSKDWLSEDKTAPPERSSGLALVLTSSSGSHSLFHKSC